MKTIESQKALDHIKNFMIANGALAWADPVVESLGRTGRGVDRTIHDAADELYAGLLKTAPAFATAFTIAFAEIVNDRLNEKIAGLLAARLRDGTYVSSIHEEPVDTTPSRAKVRKPRKH